MDYDALIAELIAAGTEPAEAARIAAATHRAAKNNQARDRERSAIQRASASDVPVGTVGRAALAAVPSADSPVRRPSYMERSDGRLPVNYGNETPQEAQERWSAQEAMDPNGVYSDGGMSAGGIFGGGAVATDTYDPGAHQRAVPMQNARVQQETLQVLSELRRELHEERQARAALEDAQAPRRFTGGRGPTRQLAAKKKRGE